MLPQSFPTIEESPKALSSALETCSTLAPGLIHRRNVYIIGAQCTGKTTLAKALITHLSQLPSSSFHPDTPSPNPVEPNSDPSPPPYTPDMTGAEPVLITELARQILRTHPITTAEIRSSPTLSLALQTSILQAQHAIERYLHSLSHPTWYLSDRSGLDPLIYTSFLISDLAYAELLARKEWTMCKEYMKEGLVVVCESGVDWLVNDGVRLMPESADEWKQLHEKFVSVLKEQEIPFKVLGNEVRELRDRVEFVVNCLKEGGGDVASSHLTTIPCTQVHE